MAHRTPQDATQHVAAPLVRGVDPVGEQEGHGARVVGEHAVRRAARPSVVALPHNLDGAADDRREQVGVEVRRDLLQHRGDALEPGAGVNGRRGERGAGAVLLEVVLHEDEVPDLQQRAALLQRHELVQRKVVLATLPIADAPQVHVDLAVRPRRPRVRHLPEVVLVAETVDALSRNPGHLPPELARFVVGVVDGDVDPLRRDPQPLFPGHPFPGVADGILLEVVTEGEVAEHLEERVVPGGVTDLLEVVVLPAGPHALLARDRAGIVPPLQTLEHALELHHPRVGEQERGVVGRHQRRAWHLSMAARGGFEVIEEGAADLSGTHGGNILSATGQVKGEPRLTRESTSCLARETASRRRHHCQHGSARRLPRRRDVLREQGRNSAVKCVTG